MVDPADRVLSQQDGELARYFGILKRWWWLLIAATAFAGTAAFFVTKQIQPTYRATATLLINQVQQPGTLAYNDVLTSERLTQTYKALVTTRPVLEAAAESDVDGRITEEQLAQKVSASVVTNTQLVTISVTDHDPERAASLTNLVLVAFVKQTTFPTPAAASATVVAESAVAPAAPFSPNMKLNVALAAAVGLLLAGGLVLLLEYLDDTLKSPEEVQAKSGLPALGEVRRWHANRGQFHLAQRGVKHSEAEAYAVLRTNVQFSTLHHAADVILITSANPGEGKSTTAVNYAIAAAEAGKRVALIDTDLRRPSLHRAFGVDNATGLTTALLKGALLDDRLLRPTSRPNLLLVPSGPLPPNPAELLDWPGFAALLDHIKESVDLVVLDSPPVLAVADARLLAARAGATVVVVDAGRTRAKSLDEALLALQRANANVIGVVLNKVSKHRGSYQYYYDEAAVTQGSKQRADELVRTPAGQSPPLTPAAPTNGRHRTGDEALPAPAQGGPADETRAPVVASPGQKASISGEPD